MVSIIIILIKQIISAVLDVLEYQRTQEKGPLNPKNSAHILEECHALITVTTTHPKHKINENSFWDN